MAIFLGSSNFSGYNGSHFTASVYLDSYSQDINANRTDYMLHLYAGSVDGYYASGVSINGYLQGNQSGSTTSFPARTQVDMGTYSGTIQHNVDGTAWLGITGYVNANAWSGVGEATVSTGWTPPTIPRQASITGNSSATIEETYTININRLVSNYNYTLRYSIVDDNSTTQTGTIASKINQDKYEWMVPEEFYQYWTKPSIKYFKIYCDTYNGNTLIGTTELQAQLTVLLKTIPNITEYTFTDENTKTVALTGDNSVMVKGYSIGRLFMVAELDYYAKVDKVYSIPEYTEISYNVEKGETSKKQVITIDNTYTNFDSLHGYRIDDTRGMQGRLVARTNKMASQPASVKQILYTTIDYVPLTLNMIARRPNATTGEIEVTFSGNYFNDTFGDVNNTLELSWKYKLKGAESWTDGGTFVKDTDYVITGNTFESKGNISLGTNFNYLNIYEIAIFYKDKLVDTYTTKIVPRGLPIFWWNKDGVYDGNNKKFLVEGEASGGDTLPIGAIVDYDGDTVPEGYESVDEINVNLKSSIIHQVTPINGSNYDNYGNTYYYKTGSRVHVHIGISLPSTSYTVILTLPIGYRPTTRSAFVGIGSGLDNFVGIQVETDGSIAVITKSGYIIADFEFDTFES